MTRRAVQRGTAASVVGMLAACGLLLLPRPVHAEPERWIINPPNSAAHFTVKHLLITPIRGTFGGIRGELWYDEQNPEASRVEAVIPTAALCSGDDQRDERLTGQDFFWAERFPVMYFRSSKVEVASDGLLVVTGDLVLRGVTRSVILEVEGPTRTVVNAMGVPTRAAVARTRLDRKDFGITWNRALEGGGVMLGDEVAVEIVLELVEPARTPEGK